MKVAIIGTGYVGLVAGACFADTGNTVVCVDKDSTKIERLRRNEIPIFEPGLEEIVSRNAKEGRLHFTTSTEEAVKQCEIIFMAVGTPSTREGDADLGFLRSAAEEVARAMPGERWIVNKSTVPVGTHQLVASWMRPLTQHKFEVISNPEFMKEGAALDDFLRPDRVVVGTNSDAAFEILSTLYAPFVRQGNPILRMDPVSAELTKYASNSYLATRISFMNELSLLCDAIGADIEKVRVGMTTDSRIGKAFLYAGAGYGGSCFPKDVRALIATAKRNQLQLGIIEASESANERQKHVLAAKIKKHFSGELKGKTFGVWGLAFKPNTDDMREAASLTLIADLLSAGAMVHVYDPVANDAAKKILGNQARFFDSAYDVAADSDGLILMTEWNEFRTPDFARLKSLLRCPVVFDGRNIYSSKQVKAAGLSYYGIGRS